RRRRLRHLIQRRIPLTQRNDAIIGNDGQQVTEPPYTALIDGHRRGPPLLPQIAQSTRIRTVLWRRPAGRIYIGSAIVFRRAVAPWILNLEQISARAATEITLSVLCGKPFAAAGASKDM